MGGWGALKKKLYSHFVFVGHTGHVDLQFLSSHWIDRAQISEEQGTSASSVSHQQNDSPYHIVGQDLYVFEFSLQIFCLFHYVLKEIL